MITFILKTSFVCVLSVFLSQELKSQIENSRLIVKPLSVGTLDSLQSGDSVSISTIFRIRNLFEVEELEVLMDSTNQVAQPLYSFIFDLKNNLALPQGTSIKRVGNNVCINMGTFSYSPNYCIYLKSFKNSGVVLDSLNTCF